MGVPYCVLFSTCLHNIFHCGLPEKAGSRKKREGVRQRGKNDFKKKKEWQKKIVSLHGQTAVANPIRLLRRSNSV